ncbi:MAG: Hsp33 family molecular chaperone HslO, partial [Gluconacetobacter diazotrophicus]|nr:Hsp33 family molecular chaperone HslO [Gluconacetobacter diazotrophicus]
SRHDNAPAVTELAGEALALVAGLASALKFKGSFSLQAKGDGPVTLLLADCTDDGALRFHARTDAERLAALLEAEPRPNAASLLGKGFLAFTVDQGPDMERHQGIVAIEGDTLADMAEHYFATSEQHACWVRLACAGGPAGWRAGGLVLERIAGEGGIRPGAELDNAVLDGEGMPRNDSDDESWTEALALASTLGPAELLDDALPGERLLFRLFHERGVAADRPRALAYGCRCSRARLASILERFPVDDLDHMEVGGDIVMTCEFCAVDFRFPRETVRGNVSN